MVQIIRRHAAEITTAVVVASLFSMYSTASVGRLLGLLPSLTRAIIPHCVTVALALPIATLLGGQYPLENKNGAEYQGWALLTDILACVSQEETPLLQLLLWS